MTSALEEVEHIDIAEWLTLATAPSSTKLKPGQTPNAVNVWVDEKPGSVITANGYVKVGTSPSGNPLSFAINYFNTSNGIQAFVCSDNATIWQTFDFQTFTVIKTGLSSVFQMRGMVIRNKLWLTNGNDAVMTWDGSTLTVLNGSGTPSVIVQDITYSAVGNSYSPTAITITYTSGGTAGSEVVTVTNTTQISVKIQSGVSTATQVLAAINGSANALLVISASITGGGANPQVAASTVHLTGGVPNVPKGTYIAYHNERVWLYSTPSARSATYFSTLSDLAANILAPDDWSAWPTSNSLQISEGDADYGTGLILYRGYLHFFKQYSIWRLVGYDEYTYSRVKTRASTGTRFNESLQIMDSLVTFIGIDGIYTFDGEQTERISDIIDPATASQESFGFNQIQQPNVNNQFWEVTATSDWNGGTTARNQTINNSMALAPCDSTQTDFNNGPTKTNIDTTTNPNFIQLSTQATGGSGVRIGQGINSYLDDSGNGEPTYGQPSWLTDGDTTRWTGLGVNRTGNDVSIAMVVDLTADQSTHVNIGRVIVRGYMTDSGDPTNVQKIQVNTGAYQQRLGSNGTWVDVYTIPNGTGGGWTPTDITVDFAVQSAIQVRIFIRAHTNGYQCSEIEAYTPAFQTTGKFVSQTLNLNTTPTVSGYLNADTVIPSNTTLTFFTQTSADGSSWDSETAVVVSSQGFTVQSVPRQYIRWVAYFTSNNQFTPTVTNVYLLTEYLSAIHNTGGNIYTWGAYQSDYNLNGNSINFYYRGATTSGGVTGASWNLIVPGGLLTMLTTYQYVQFRVEILGGKSSAIPVVDNGTINWVVGTGTQPPILQNVASFFWRNRYWLSAASNGSLHNNIILIRGKKTFANPWQLKDWPILSFCRYFDNLYGCSSIDGSIYQLDTGYSKAGSAMNSIFETGDFLFGGFQVQTQEANIEVEQTGPYSMNLGISLDRGQTYTDYPVDLTPNGMLSHVKRVNVDSFTSDRFRMRVYINDVDKPFEVHNLRIYYIKTATRGSITSNDI